MRMRWRRRRSTAEQPTARLDPASVLVKEKRERCERGQFSTRDQLASIGAGGSFVLGAAAIAVLFPPDELPSLPVVAMLVATYALVSRVEFEVGAGSAVPTQLVLVPMLFELPPSLVPACVAAGLVLGSLPARLRTCRRERVSVLLSSSWHAIGPALVLALAGQMEPSWGAWPLYLAALGAQFAFDFASSSIRDAVAYGVSPSTAIRFLSWVYGVDAALAPVGLLTAFAATTSPVAVTLTLPLAFLFRVFAEERRRRLDHAVALGNLHRGTAVLAEAYHDVLAQRLDRPLEQISDTLSRLIPHDGVTILSTEEDGRLVPALVRPEGSSESSLGPVEQHSRRAIESRRALQGAFDPSGEGFLVVPLLARGLAKGAIALRRGPDAPSFSDDEVQLARWFGDAAALALDLLERKRVDEQLREAQKLEAIGQLAGGIAHDFNNRLLAVRGYTELALARLDGDAADLRRHLRAVQDAADGGATLTRQLLAFSRRQVLQARTIDLNELVGSLEPRLGRLLGEDVALVLRLGPALPPISADPGSIEQILANLVCNARDAMPAGGTVTISTALRDADEAAGCPVVLEVADTGRGMDAETRARAFEPFFTTSEFGAATGLGLASVHGAVTQSGGTIELASEPGFGTVITIGFPAAAADPPPAAEPQTDDETGAATVLVVEDEEAVRAVIEQALEDQGYAVVTAANGAEGLELARSRLDRIDLVLTDVVMPRLTGPQLVAELRGLRHDLPVLFMSGYADRAADLGDVPLLDKPFTLADLAAAVRGALERSEPADAPIARDPVAV
jgi:signal transduction histidine kinase/CheY-like chemotaxis protein